MPKPVAYAVHLEPAYYGGYFASCRDLPNVWAHGDYLSETLRRASDMMDLFLKVLVDEDEALPVPTPVSWGEIWVSPSDDMQTLLKPYFARMP